MARTRRRKGVPSVPAAVLLLGRRLSMAHGGSASPAFVPAGVPDVGVQIVQQQRERRSLAPTLSTAARSAPVARRPKAAAAATGGGSGGGGIVVGPVAGHSEKQVEWLGRIDYYGGREMWRKAEEKFQQMQDEGVYPTLPICNSLMEAYLKGKRYVNAVGFLEDLCLGNISTDVAHDGMRVLEMPATSGTSDEASDGAPPAATTPIVPNLRTFNLVIATLASGGKWKKALDVSAPMRSGRGGSGGGGGGAAAVAAAGRGAGRGRGGGRGGRGDAASRAVTSVAEGLAADAETYTHLIVACGRGGEPDRSRQMFDEMRGGGISPPPEATAALIKALAKGGRGSSEALRLLGDMRASASTQQQAGGRVYLGGMSGGAAEAEAGRERSEAAAQSAGFEGAIEACAANGEWQKAVSLLDEMRLARMSPDSRCYGNAMRACAAGGNWQLSLALLNTMKKEGVTRTAFNFNIAMQACRKADRSGKAIYLLEEMEKDGVAPDIVTYNTCVTIAGQAGRLDEALELLRKASEEGGLELDVVSYRAALGGLRREKRWEAAVKLLGDMQRRGLGPDEVCTAMAMNTCVSAQQPLRALDLFRDMRDVGRVFPRLSSVTALLEAYAVLGRWEDALVELRALSASGVKPDGRAIAFAMAACNSSKKWDQTLGLYQYAIKMGIDSSMEGLVLVARAYGARKDWQAVGRVLATAEEACASAAAAAANDGGGRVAAAAVAKHPPAELYEVVARSLALTGKWEEAASAVRRLEKLSPRKAHQQRGENVPAAAARTSAAGLGTYEMIMGAALKAGRYDAVLAQADAARAALRDAASSSSPSSGYDHDSGGRGGGGGGTSELNPAALAHEATAAGRLGQWDRVSPLLAKAMRSPELRGIAGARLYSALISATAACGKPRRGLEVFEEMLVSSGGGDGDGGEDNGGGGGDTLGAMAAQAALSTGEVAWGDQVWGEGFDGTVREGEVDTLARGGEGGGSRRLPPPDGATFLAALDACAAVGGEESASLVIGVTKDAAAAAREFQQDGSGSGSGNARKARLSTRRLTEVLSKAGEVCAAAGEESTAEALAAKAVQLGGEGGGGGEAATPLSTSSPIVAKEEDTLEEDSGAVGGIGDPR